MSAKAALDRIGAFSPIDLIEDRSDSGLLLAVALDLPASLQLHVDFDQALRSLEEGWPHEPLAAVAQRAARILMAGLDGQAWRRLPSEVGARVGEVKRDLGKEAEAYDRPRPAALDPIHDAAAS